MDCLTIRCRRNRSFSNLFQFERLCWLTCGGLDRYILKARLWLMKTVLLQQQLSKVVSIDHLFLTRVVAIGLTLPAPLMILLDDLDHIVSGQRRVAILEISSGLTWLSIINELVS